MITYRTFCSQLPFVGSLLLIAFLGFQWINKPEKTISVIAVSPTGTTLMTKSKKELRKTEQLNFLTLFAERYFTFNNDEKSPLYYKNTLATATRLMTKDLWKSKGKDDYSRQIKIMENVSYSQISKDKVFFICEEEDLIVGRCTAEELGQWELFLTAHIKINDKVMTKKAKIIFKLIDVERVDTETEKWGLKINEIKKII